MKTSHQLAALALTLLFTSQAAWSNELYDIRAKVRDQLSRIESLQVRVDIDYTNFELEGASPDEVIVGRTEWAYAPDGRVRFLVTHSYPRETDAAKFELGELSVFDGQIGKSVSLDNAGRQTAGAILNDQDIAEIFYEESFSGSEFGRAYGGFINGKSLTEWLYLDNAQVIGQKTIDDVDCVIVEAADSQEGFSQRFMIAPEFGYALKAYESLRGGEIIFSITNTKFQEIQEGLWMPVAGVIDPHGRTYLNRPPAQPYPFRVQELRVNEPIDDDLFNLTFDTGLRINDRRFHVVFRWAEEMEDRILDGAALFDDAELLTDFSSPSGVVEQPETVSEAQSTDNASQETVLVPSGLAPGQSTTRVEIGATTVPPYMLRWFEGEIRGFAEAHPEIGVYTTALGGPIRPFSMLIESLPRLPRDVLGIQTLVGNELDYLISRRLIVPLETFLPDDEFDPGVFTRNVWKSVTRDGKRWGIPILLDSAFLLYDPVALAQVGFDEPPKTWDDLLRYSAALTRDINGDGAIDQWGLCVPPGIGVEAFLWQAIDRQYGVQYAPDGVINFDQPQIRKNLLFIRDLLNSPHTDQSIPVSFARPIGRRNSAMMIMNNYIQHLPLVINPMTAVLNNPKLRVAHLPSNADPVTGTGLRLYLVIRKSTSEREQASWKFLKWMSRPNIPMGDIWFGFPARRDLAERQDVQTFFATGIQDYHIMLEATARARPADIQFSPSAFDSIPMILDRYVKGRIDLDEAIGLLNELGTRMKVLKSGELNKGELIFE